MGCNSVTALFFCCLITGRAAEALNLRKLAFDREQAFMRQHVRRIAATSVKWMQMRGYV